MRQALKNFALDEFQHKLRLEGIRDGQVQFHDDEVGNLGIAASVDYVIPHPGMTYKELLAFAIKKEDEAQRLYSKMSQLAKDEKVKEMFRHLAQEEAQHKLNLEFEYDLTAF